MEETEKNRDELKCYLRSLRKRHSYSQEYVASRLDIQRQTYSHYETGRIKPPAAALYKIAKLYGIPVEDLLELSVHMETPQIAEEPITPQPVKVPIADKEAQAYTAYMQNPFNIQKLQYLDNRERKLIYYYENLDAYSKTMAMAVMKAFFEK